MNKRINFLHQIIVPALLAATDNTANPAKCLMMSPTEAASIAYYKHLKVIFKDAPNVISKDGPRTITFENGVVAMFSSIEFADSVRGHSFDELLLHDYPSCTEYANWPPQDLKKV